MAGDVTVTANRSNYADFTVPFSESGVGIVVPVKHNERTNAWIFMKPLTTGLWLTIGAFFVFTGFVVWVLEHRVNEEFRGPPRQQVGMIFFFSFSTLVFAHSKTGILICVVLQHLILLLYQAQIVPTYFDRGESDKQLDKICGDCVGVRGASFDVKLHSKLNINANSRATAA